MSCSSANDATGSSQSRTLHVHQFPLWDIGSHSIVLEGLQQADVEDIMNALQCLSMLPARELQMVGSLPYTLGYLEWSNKPVMQLPGALQSQVPSA